MNGRLSRRGGGWRGPMRVSLDRASPLGWGRRGGGEGGAVLRGHLFSLFFFLHHIALRFRLGIWRVAY